MELPIHYYTPDELELIRKDMVEMQRHARVEAEKRGYTVHLRIAAAKLK